MTSLEESLRDAFQLAENSRRSAGLERRSISEMKTTRKDGTVWIGPSSYMCRLWFRPWHYADLMHAKLMSDRPDQSLNNFVQGIIDKHIKQVATRPEPKPIKTATNVIPLRARKRIGNATAVMNAKAAARASAIAHREAHG